MKIENRKAAYDVLYLAACVLKGHTPDADRVKQMDMEQLYIMSLHHSLPALVCEGLEQAEALPENADKVMAAFREAKAKAIRKNILLDSERGKLFAFMEKQGIWYMPLKGALLKDMYPKLGLRQMSDNDILFDKVYQQEIRKWFEEQGYKVKSFGIGNHDTYEKKPVYNYEMHTSLFAERANASWYEYYKNIKERLIKDADCEYGYHFSEEDFYVYMVLHTFKHYNNAGTGLRYWMDMYVYLQKKGSSLDWQYVQQELQKLEIAEFEQNSRQVLKELFEASPELLKEENFSEQAKQMLEYCICAGGYGNLENRTEKRLQEIQKEIGKCSKLQYYWGRLFPDLETMKTFYPQYFEHKYTVPFAYIGRIVRGVMRQNKTIMREIKYVENREK